MQRPYRLVAFALLALFPFALAQEPGKEAPRPPAGKPEAAGEKAPEPGALFLEKFDLNKDGKVDWEEYQKVRSGFTGFDANGDGVVTSADFTIIMERNQARMQKAMQKRMKEMRQGWGRRTQEAMGRMRGAMGQKGRRGGPGMGPQMQPQGRGRGGPGMGPWWMQQQGQGQGQGGRGMGPRWMQPQGPGQGGPGPGAMGQGPRGPMADGDTCPWCHQPRGGGGAQDRMGPGRGMRWGFGAPGADDDDDNDGPPRAPGPPGR